MKRSALKKITLRVGDERIEIASGEEFMLSPAAEGKHRVATGEQTYMVSAETAGLIEQASEEPGSEETAAPSPRTTSKRARMNSRSADTLRPWREVIDEMTSMQRSSRGPRTRRDPAHQLYTALLNSARGQLLQMFEDYAEELADAYLAGPKDYQTSMGSFTQELGRMGRILDETSEEINRQYGVPAGSVTDSDMVPPYAGSGRSAGKKRTKLARARSARSGM